MRRRKVADEHKPSETPSRPIGVSATPYTDALKEAIAVTELAREIGRHPSAGIRWARDGVRRPDGGRRFLRSFKTPGGWVSTRRWFEEFLQAITEDARRRPPGVDTAGHAAADALCEAAGI